jgi:hypothetical protein
MFGKVRHPPPRSKKGVRLPSLAEGLVSTVALMLAVACGRERAPTGSRSAPAVTASAARALEVEDMAAYERGKMREIALANTALTVMQRTRDPNARAIVAAGAGEEHLDSAGAEAAGIPVRRYRQLVVQVDSVLLKGEEDPGGEASTQTAAQTRAAWLPRLDSLRVQLTVLLSRLAAESERVCSPAAGVRC